MHTLAFTLIRQGQCNIHELKLKCYFEINVITVFGKAFHVMSNLRLVTKCSETEIF